MGGFDHLLYAIEKCTNLIYLKDFLSLVSAPLQMLNSNWAMDYILRIFAAIKMKTIECLSLDELLSDAKVHSSTN